MGSISRRKRAGGVSWDVRWRDPDGNHRKRAFHRRVDAERFLSTVSTDIIRGDYVDPNDPTTFREFAESWRESRMHRPTTRAHVETHLRRHAYPRFGDRRLSSIRPSEIQRWVTALTQTLAPATVQVIHGIVASIYKSALHDRLVNSSPCAGTRLPKRLPVQITPLTTEAVRALANTVPGRYRALVLLAAGTGLRQGECLGFDEAHVDLDQHSLRVDQQLILLSRRAPFFGPPKTPASHRTVPLPDVVVAALRRHLAEFPVTHPDRLLFTDDHGNAIRRTAFSYEVWRPAVAAVGARRGTGLLSTPLARLGRPNARRHRHPPRRQEACTPTSADRATGGINPAGRIRRAAQEYGAAPPRRPRPLSTSSAGPFDLEDSRSTILAPVSRQLIKLSPSLRSSEA